MRSGGTVPVCVTFGLTLIVVLLSEELLSVFIQDEAVFKHRN
jgi:hypothetical protein